MGSAERPHRTAVTNVRVFDGAGGVGNPLQDITATRSIRRIWCGGVEVVPAGLPR